MSDIGISNAGKERIEQALLNVVEAAVASAVSAMQKVNEQRDLAVNVLNMQLTSAAINSQEVAKALADAIRALPPDDLIRFVKATDANVTNINVGLPSCSVATTDY